MSITAVGPAFSLDGPPPGAPPHSLLNTEGVVVERDATRVLNGVNVWSYPTGCSSTWEPCLEGTYRVKDDASEMLTPRFDAFVVYKPVTCSAFGLRDPGELFDRAEAVLDATISAAVERALAAGVEGSSNPYFLDGNEDDVSSGSPGPASEAVALLERAIGDTCRQGMLHLTPATLALLQPWPNINGKRDSLISVNGTPIASEMGLQGIDEGISAGTDWAFATGPVRVYLGPVRLDSVKENLDRSDNTLTFRAERYVLAIWDTALQAAAQVIIVD